MRLRASSLFLAGIALVSLSACDKLGIGGGDADAPAKDEKAAALAASTGGATVVAAGPNFGDDASPFSKDGECDDKTFEGAGMTSTPLLDTDVGHDATDCRAAFNQNRLTLRANSAAVAAVDPAQVSRIQWGDDNGSFSNDGECDDKRFMGAGMTSTQLLDSDIKHDATDCRTAFQQGRLSLRT